MKHCWLGFALLACTFTAHAARWPEVGHFAPWYSQGEPFSADTPKSEAWIEGIGEKWLKIYTKQDLTPMQEGVGSQLALLESWDSLSKEQQRTSRSVRCYGLLQIGQLGDAFNCAKTLEADLFARYTAYEKHSPVELAGWAAPSAPFAKIFFAPFEIYAEYYLAIGDPVSAAGYADRACAIYDRLRFSLWNGDAVTSPLELRCLPLSGIAKAAMGDEQGALEVLNRLDKEYARISAFKRSQFEDLYQERKLNLLFALKDWQAAKTLLANYKPGERSTKSMKRSLMTNLVVGIIGTAALSPDALLHLFSAAAATPGFSKLLARIQADALLVNNFRRAKVAYETGDQVLAAKLYDELLLAPNLIVLPQMLQVTIYADRASIHRTAGETSQSIANYYQAINLIESQRATLSTEAGRIGFLGDRQAVYASLVNTLVDADHVAEAFRVVERAKSRALVELLASKTSITGGNSQSVGESFIAANHRAIRHDYSISIDEMNKTRGIILAEKSKLVAKDVKLAALLTGSVPTTESMTSLVKTTDTLLEYYGLGSHWYVFVVANGKITVQRLDSAGLEEDIRRFRQQLQNPGSKNVTATAALLYQRLVQPIVNLIHTQSVSVVPHGALHYVPFTAFYDGQDWWSESVSIRVLPSASVLNYLQKPPRNQTTSLLALGNPDLGNPKLDLPGAEREVEMLSKLNSNTRAYFRTDASETLLRREAPKYSRIHIATHGIFDQFNPLSSRLLLAADDQNDGNLTLPELYDLNINADLVTLSACETGLAKIAPGDDLVGLTRGWLFAGARTVVASLWKVDDEATSMLMKHFYESLDEGLSPRDSLQSAQTKVQLHYPNPFYWSAFEVIGAD